MKRLLLFTLMFQVTTPRLALNQITGKWYSTKASWKMDKEEYNEMMLGIVAFCKSKEKALLELTAQEMAMVYAFIRLVESAAANQLIKDLDEVLEEAKKDINKINGKK